jgi:hypothetical protein
VTVLDWSWPAARCASTRRSRVSQVELAGQAAFWTAPDAADWNVGETGCGSARNATGSGQPVLIAAPSVATAVARGDALITRLVAAGLKFEVREPVR